MPEPIDQASLSAGVVLDLDQGIGGRLCQKDEWAGRSVDTAVRADHIEVDPLPDLRLFFAFKARKRGPQRSVVNKTDEHRAARSNVNWGNGLCDEVPNGYRRPWEDEFWAKQSGAI